MPIIGRVVGLMLFCVGLAAGASAQGEGLSLTRVAQGPIASDGGATGAAWADFDGDGDLDLFTVGTMPNTFVKGLYRNDGDGTFTKLSGGTLLETGNVLRGLSWGDYDNDGNLDVAVAGTPSLVYGNAGDGTFTVVELGDAVAPDVRGWSPSWADYDNDGYLDLFITHPAGFAGSVQRNHLFRNGGPPDFRLTRVPEVAVSAESAPFTSGNWTDFDGDGDLDLFVGSGPANGLKGLDFYYRNLLSETGSAAFERIRGTPFADQRRDGQVVNWIDIDNDRDLDFFVTNWGGQLGGLENELYRNDCGTFVRVTEGPLVTDRAISLANVWGDLDNDGDLDVVVANSGRNGFYLNRGDGTFERVAQGAFVADSNANWSASLGDYDDDGDLDVFIPALRPNARHFLYRNDLAKGNAWIALDLVGTVSNRAGIGAKVHARARIDGRHVWQQREVSSQNSFLGHNMLRVHFGFGDASWVDKLVIEWPSGATDRFADVEVNRRLRATEGGGLAAVE